MYIPKVAKTLFPNIFAPAFLGELPPSWSGIFARIWSPIRTVHHPIRGTYQVSVMSRDEEKRCKVRDFEEMIKRLPPGSYHEVPVVYPYPKGHEDWP